MSYGSPIMRQHVVEFIRGTGVITDGVADDALPDGPWNWTVPLGVTSVSINGCGAGGGGGSGWNAGVSRAGGGGGGGALSIQNYVAPCYPLSTLNITIAAGATPNNNGGGTVITGLCPQAVATAPMYPPGTTGGTFYIMGGGAGFSAGSTSSGSSGAGGQSVSFVSWVNNAGGNSNSASPANGNSGGELISFNCVYGSALLYVHSGTTGGAANTTGTLAGGRGGHFTTGTTNMRRQWPAFTGSSGNTDGTVSYGGGGGGGPTFYGTPGLGGNGNAAGANATGFGAGGGGGGGNAAGGNGSPGYCSITYWSVD